MSALGGERDRLIMNTVPRYIVSVVEKALLLQASTPVFAVSRAGSATPAAITITAELVSITGTVEFSVSAGAALVVDGKVATLRFVDMTVDVAFVQAKVKDAESGVEFLRSAVISKVFDGATGADGATYYTWVKYSDSATGAGLSDNPTGKDFIGLAYNKTTPIEGTDSAAYTWSLIKGVDGVPGAPGVDGLTTYTWIKYSDLPDGTGLYDLPTASTLYLGLATNKTTSVESGNKADYTWSKFKGDQGVPGANAPPLYTWVKYADSAAGAGLTDDPAGKTFIGLAYNKPTAVESADPAQYSWSLIRGADGVPGTPGADGQPLYTWIKYADVADGTGLYDMPTASTMYLGLSSNRNTPIESANKADYVWSKFRGDQGVPGTDAPARYTWVKYGDSATGAGLSDSPAGKAYIGLAYNKLTAVESATAGDYEWALIKGTDGVPGAKGADGATLYTWIKYADFSDGTGLYDVPTANTLYLGLAVNKTTSTESTNKADYVWSKFRGDQGVPGTTGPQGQRGTKTVVAGGYSTWSDASAAAELAAAGFGAPINRDMVTLYGPVNSAPTFTMTKFYDNGSWMVLGAHQDGGLLVNGTVAAQALSVDHLSAISANLGSVTAGNMYGVSVRGGDYQSGQWPENGGTGFWLGTDALRLGNFSTGRYFEVTSNGDFAVPGLRVSNGSATFSGRLSGAVGSFNLIQSPNRISGGAEGYDQTGTGLYFYNPDGSIALAIGKWPR